MLDVDNIITFILSVHFSPHDWQLVMNGSRQLIPAKRKDQTRYTTWSYSRIKQEWRSTPPTIHGPWTSCLTHVGLCGAAAMGRKPHQMKHKSLSKRWLGSWYHLEMYKLEILSQRGEFQLQNILRQSCSCPAIIFSSASPPTWKSLFFLISLFDFSNKKGQPNIV